jgi:hypothetical protein
MAFQGNVIRLKWRDSASEISVAATFAAVYA